MPAFARVSYRELAAKLNRAGQREILTSRHAVYYLADKDVTVPVPRHTGDVPVGTLRAIVRETGLERGRAQ